MNVRIARIEIPPHPDHLPAASPPSAAGQESNPWNQAACRALLEALWALRAELLGSEHRFGAQLAKVSDDYLASARNLAHYLGLRRRDRRQLQEQLASLGLSSLGRAESHVLANLDKVLGILHSLTGQPWRERSAEEPVGMRSSRDLLARHTAALLGEPHAGRAVRVMVTLPAEAADDEAFVYRLVEAGMDVARINCAHDDAEAWGAMAGHVRRAAGKLGRPVRVLMDLGGPKLRTGEVAPGPRVLKLKPQRDALGHVVRKARLRLRAEGAVLRGESAEPQVGVDVAWLDTLTVGERVDLVDARGARRSLRIVSRSENEALAETDRTVYLVPATRLDRAEHPGGPRSTTLADLSARPGTVLLRTGGLLRLTRSGVATARGDELTTGHPRIPSIACTLPEVFAQVRAGERIWFDDGKIGGIIREAGDDELIVEIVSAKPNGSRLAGDKGINLPDSALDLPALTATDIEDLRAVARHADLVGLSFVQHGSDVEALRVRLAALGADSLGIILKIETRRAFANLPELMLAAMESHRAGVMIARGDLAVECGYERLAEVQEEILWAAEAAHMPVIWATQVLETLAKTGQPSRAEITDAAMGERAECVMLNKGPHILEAIHALDDILTRMQSHQAKKRSLLRALSAWAPTI
ncbi:pyruvate kinase [Thauera phenolivorans]|uniref:pyruvate kinase n=1 Tax=Thauera phenolivorans TaxID=1792543 RepID=UPI0009F625AC|nr:pyruvate kinase [Thauera phenolivorans]